MLCLKEKGGLIVVGIKTNNMRSSIMKSNAILSIILLSVLMLQGCSRTGRAGVVSKYDGVTNVREVAGGYIMYEIESGTVTCREHRSRSELACWKNGK